MSDIPEDILKAAEEAFDLLLCNCTESCGGTDGLRKASIEEIGKAILAERERSIERISHYQSLGPNPNWTENGAVSASAFCAALINDIRGES